jgi:hypothetical protein
MSDQNNTPPHLEAKLKFQMQAITQMMERMNFVMGNVCDKLDRVVKHGNEVGTSTQDMRNVRAEPKANNGSRDERRRLANYEEDIADIGDGGFEDEAIGHQEGFRQPRETKGILGIELGVNSAKGKISAMLGDMMISESISHLFVFDQFWSKRKSDL